EPSRMSKTSRVCNEDQKIVLGSRRTCSNLESGWITSECGSSASAPVIGKAPDQSSLRPTPRRLHVADYGAPQRKRHQCYWWEPSVGAFFFSSSPRKPFGQCRE